MWKLAAVAVLSGCLPGAWEDVPTARVHAEAPADHLESWKTKIEAAITAWVDVLPDGCPAPFELVDASPHAIRLVPNAEWEWDGVLGIQTENDIEVRLDQGSVKTTATHELGHAMGLDHETSALSVMATNAGDANSSQMPTAKDGASAACVLGCGPC